jgi:hypothetical protein
LIVKNLHYNDAKFNITPQHLGQVIRDNNKTRKRTRHEHFPKERYKKPIEKANEMNNFFTEVCKFPINNILKIYLCILSILTNAS